MKYLIVSDGANPMLLDSPQEVAEELAQYESQAEFHEDNCKVYRVNTDPVPVQFPVPRSMTVDGEEFPV